MRVVSRGLSPRQPHHYGHVTNSQSDVIPVRPTLHVLPGAHKAFVSSVEQACVLPFVAPSQTELITTMRNETEVLVLENDLIRPGEEYLCHQEAPDYLPLFSSHNSLTSHLL